MLASSAIIALIILWSIELDCNSPKNKLVNRRQAASATMFAKAFSKDKLKGAVKVWHTAQVDLTKCAQAASRNGLTVVDVQRQYLLPYGGIKDPLCDGSQIRWITI